MIRLLLTLALLCACTASPEDHAQEVGAEKCTALSTGKVHVYVCYRGKQVLLCDWKDTCAVLNPGVAP